VHFSSELEYRSIANDEPERVENFVRRWSGGLIEVKQQPSGSYVQFIHESVRDFLIQENGFSKLDTSLNEGAIGKSHDQLKSLCIKYIDTEELRSINLQEEARLENSSAQLFSKYPFLDYAVTSVFTHAEKAESEGIRQDQLVTPFGKPTNPLFQCWRYLYDSNPNNPNIRRHDYGPQATFFYVASEYNLLSCIQVLLDSGVDVNIRGGYFETALNAAAFRRHHDMVQILLDKGATVYLFKHEYRDILQVRCLF
jgi:hypothetical protein